MSKFKKEIFKKPEAVESNEIVKQIKTRENMINIGSGYLEDANADFDGNIIDPLIIVPMLNTKNLLTSAADPYTDITDHAFKDYINNIDKKYTHNYFYGIVENIKIRYAHQLSCIVITNMNIIFDAGIIRFLKNYVSDINYMRKTYLEKISQEAFCLFSSNIRSIFGRIVCEDNMDTVFVDYTQKNMNQLDSITFTGKEVLAYIMNFISNRMYEFINDIIFSDMTNCTAMNLDILSDFNPAFRNSTMEKKENAEIISSSSKSMCIQYLLEMLNMDMHVIKDMIIINYYNTVNMMISDIILANQNFNGN